jgi:hypothetical protein
MGVRVRSLHKGWVKQFSKVKETLMVNPTFSNVMRVREMEMDAILTGSNEGRTHSRGHEYSVKWKDNTKGELRHGRLTAITISYEGLQSGSGTTHAPES